ncbi:hypothetical protein Gpo141_00013074 [Globisporangium polare]
MTFLIEDAAHEDFQAALTFVDEYESSSSEFSDEVPVARHLAIRNGRTRKPTLSKTVESLLPDGDELLSLGELDLMEIPSLIDQGPQQFTSPFLPNFESPLLRKPSLPVHLRQFRPVQPKTKKVVPAAASTTKNGKKPITWDPNKARNERKGELMYLRKQVVDLQHQLDNIKTKKPRLATSSQVHPCPPSSQQIAPRARSTSSQPNSAVANVWKAVADRQREERVKSERENIRLKLVLEGQLKIAKSLEEMLNKTITPSKKAEECVNGKKLTHVYPPTADRSDYATFEELLAGVDEAYSEIDAVFEANGLAKCETMHSDAKMRLNGSNGIYLEVFRGKVLPFETHATSEAVWHHFANPTERRPYRHFYEKSEAVGATEDSLVENFNMVLHANRTSAIFRVKRILRRYVEEDRIVVVWWAFIDPIELSEEPLTGVRFLEKGYILIKKPTSVDGDFSLLQSCYITTPVFTGEWTQDDHPQVGAITDFVLSSTESSISASHQMIEDVLLRQAMKTSGL